MDFGFGYSLIGSEKGKKNSISFQAINPKTNNPIQTVFYQASCEEVSSAIHKAKQAFESLFPIDIETRIRLIKTIVANIEKYKAELTHWFCLESGLSLHRSEVELARAVFQFLNYAKGIENGYALERKAHVSNDKRTPKPRPQLEKFLVPLGPVVVFGASNFPLAYSTLGGDVASAFAAGCPVIVKAHAMHPHTSSLSAQLIAEAVSSCGLDDGYFSHLLAKDYSVGEQLVASEDVKAVGFTGSILGGVSLQKIINKRQYPIPLFAEMGSSNPIVFSVSPSSKNFHKHIKSIAEAVVTDAGQFCTSPGLLFIEHFEDQESIIAELTQYFSTAEPCCMLHPGITKRYVERKAEQATFVKLLFEGKVSENYIQATLSQVSANEFCMENSIQEEIFGSYLTLVICNGKEEVVSCLKKLKGQLTASIFSDDDDNISAYINHLIQIGGRVVINGVPTGVEVSVAQQHGGPFPSSTSPYFSSVGWDAIKRFSRPVTIQGKRVNLDKFYDNNDESTFFTIIND